MQWRQTLAKLHPLEPADEPPWNPRPSGFLRPKGNLSKNELRVLLVLALLPLASVVLRILALPGVFATGLGLDFLRGIGSALTDTLSLSGVPADEREHVLYLLFVPTCALLVALARLTFGIRVLGFRSILIAVGFHQAGIVPSLFLLGVAIATILLVRPWLKRIRLPYYGRVSVVLCIVAMTMVAALLAAPWMRSNVLWGIAYFPVIVLGMLAEGIAHSLERDSMVTATWRAVTTIALGFVLALICYIPALRNLLLQFPELVLTQSVAIIFVSEFLDLRLFQDWDSRVAGIARPKLRTEDGRYRVAVVRNRDPRGVIGQLGRRGPGKHARRSVQKLVDALRAGGHSVKVLEGDTSLLRELRKFIPPDPRTGEPGGIVFNLAHGIQGNARYTHVPAMLEMAGVAYTGASPAGQAMALDKVVAKTLLQQAGVPTPAFRLLGASRDRAADLRYPLVVKPRHEPKYGLRVVRDREELRIAVKTVIKRFRQEAVVEEYIVGRRISAALLGNDPVECLPLVENDRTQGTRICPAPLEDAVAAAIRIQALAAFWACGCRDYARIDLRVTPAGEPIVLEIETFGILDRGGAFALAASRAGLEYSELVCRIVEVARARAMAGESFEPAPFHPVRPARTKRRTNGGSRVGAGPAVGGG